ncbi:MAG: DNA topoisomerase IV subunit A [Erysipelotrichaceae bacterium]|nr:DNA topoisomerase IV subunit A [Erysipelotrichaceae bacterium]
MKTKQETIVVREPLDDLISERYGESAKYIIQDRALPDARDGLKPVQRRILYAMYKDGNTADKAFRKSAKTVGLVIGNYHPHGDSSVYEAMVRLSQDWKQNIPLVEMHGNNGSIDDDPAAAMRYTEARLAAISDTLLKDIDKDTVSWTPNFDDTENEPTVLPAKFPNLLVNGATGIAAGYATNIPPHNLQEIVQGTIYRINNPDCSLDAIMDIIKGPDFPTGGIVQGIQGIRDAFTTGKGRVVVRSKVSIESTKSVQQIIVSEIPFEVIKVNLVKKIDEIRFNHDIEGILDVRDESDRNGLRIVIDVNKDSDANNILNYLYKNTDLQVYYSYNMIAIVDQRPVQLGLLEALDSYIAFRKDVVIARSHFEFNKRIERCHILEGLIKAVSILDEIIKIIRSSKDKADAKNRLIKAYEFTEPQAEAIVTLRLYRLTNTDIFELKNEFATLVGELKELKEIIENPKKLNQVICEELQEVAEKFAEERKTVIEHEVSDIQIDKASMIANEHVVITLSRDGYAKRVSMRSYSSNESLTGIKEDDQLIGYLEADTIDSMLAFTASGEYVCLPIYQLKEAKWKDIGDHVSSMVKLNNSEKFVGACLVKDFNTYAWIVTLSSGGMIKKSAVNQWQLQRNSRSSQAMKLDDGDSVIAAAVVYENDEVILVSRDGYCMRFPVKDIPEVGVKSKGVIACRLSGDDVLVSMAIANGSGTEAVFMTGRAGAKRIKIGEIEETRRATKGLLIAKKNKTNPHEVRYCFYGNLSDSLNLYTDEGKMDLSFRDVGLMNKDARFSNPLTNRPFYHETGIQEVRIVDFPPEEDAKLSYEEVKLEV